MNAENFAYWINGALELGQLKELNAEQVKIVQDHLGLVIKKVTPQYQFPTLGVNPPAKPNWTTLPYTGNPPNIISC